MVLRKFQNGGRIKLKIQSEAGNLKGDLSIDTTFYPPLKGLSSEI
jgi:hypothetical protein